jgi:hypothetical protein
LEEFGHVDVVMDKAGILHDKSFNRISDPHWGMFRKEAASTDEINLPLGISSVISQKIGGD